MITLSVSQLRSMIARAMVEQKSHDRSSNINEATDRKYPPGFKKAESDAMNNSPHARWWSKKDIASWEEAKRHMRPEILKVSRQQLIPSFYWSFWSEVEAHDGEDRAFFNGKEWVRWNGKPVPYCDD